MIYMNFTLPKNVLNIISKMESNGFQCYTVGGCVRDMILGLTPKDYDLTSNAKPDEIISIFKDYKIIDAGIKHGTVAVIVDNEVYEITTYRIDGDYEDNRHPKNVEFTTSLKEDLARRDFTVNAMAYNPSEGVIDYFNGQEDLKFKAIRCVGEPDKRFKEDALRILRALRFASTYNFSVEFNTYNAIAKNKELLNNISKERIATELVKTLCGENCSYILRRFKDVFAVIIPEISTMFYYDQNTPHHNKTLWKHTVSSVKHIDNDPILRMTMLLHDIGKPMSENKDENGVSHFRGHEKTGAGIAKIILERLRYPKDFTETVVNLISIHDLRIQPDRIIIKKVLKNIGSDNFSMLMKIQMADVLSQSSYHQQEKIDKLNKVNSIFRDIMDNDECFSLKYLKVNGSDLMSCGMSKGKIIGDTLNLLLNKVIENTLINDKETLLQYVRKNVI